MKKYICTFVIKIKKHKNTNSKIKNNSNTTFESQITKYDVQYKLFKKINVCKFGFFFFLFRLSKCQVSLY